MNNSSTNFDLLKYSKNLIHTEMVPLKWSMTFDPPQIALLYLKHIKDKKKQLFMIQLNGLIWLGDADKITRILFIRHSQYLSIEKISFKQVRKLVLKILDHYNKNKQDFEIKYKTHNEQHNIKDQMTPIEYLEAVKQGFIEPSNDYVKQLKIMGYSEFFESEEESTSYLESDTNKSDRFLAR